MTDPSKAYAITHFSWKYNFLSNFYPAQVTLDGETYPSVEHAYQAAKTMDPWLRQQIRDAQTPAAAKRIGRIGVLRPDWDEVKIGVMRDLLQQKFSCPRLRTLLARTAPRQLIEGNHWGDRFWGQSPVGQGQNWLGRLLMEIRDR